MPDKTWLDEFAGLTPEEEAELIEHIKNYEINPETQKRIDAFNTPVSDSTWYKIVP